MSLRSILLKLLSTHPRIKLSSEYSQTLRNLAEREGITLEEMIERVISDAKYHCTLADSIRNRWTQLTPREQEISNLICQGYGYNQIAQKLYISPATVKSHARSVLQKLGMRNKSALRRALEELKISSFTDQ